MMGQMGAAIATPSLVGAGTKNAYHYRRLM